MRVENSATKSPLPGEAIFELRFKPEDDLPPEIREEVTRALLKGRYVQREGENTGGIAKEPIRLGRGWTLQIDSRAAVLRSPVHFEFHDLSGRIRKLRDSLRHAIGATTYELVGLRHLNAIAVERIKAKELLTEWVRKGPWGAEMEFAQTTTWVSHGRSHFLEYGIRPVLEKPVYFWESMVSAENVRADELESVVRQLYDGTVESLSWSLDPKLQSRLKESRYVAHSRPSDLLIFQDRLSLFAGGPGRTQIVPSLSPETLARWTTEERAELVARKHGGGDFTAEDEARLEGLTQRVRALLPRVKEESWRSLTKIATSLEETEDRLQEIRRRHDLGPS